jgi:hypothetical protein
MRRNLQITSGQSLMNDARAWEMFCDYEREQNNVAFPLHAFRVFAPKTSDH